MSKIIFSEEGWDDYLYWQSENKKILQKINKLLKSISRDGALSGEGKPEKLKHKDNKSLKNKELVEKNRDFLK